MGRFACPFVGKVRLSCVGGAPDLIGPVEDMYLLRGNCLPREKWDLLIDAFLFILLKLPVWLSHSTSPGSLKKVAELGQEY